MLELALPFVFGNFTGSDIKRTTIAREIIQIESPMSVTPVPDDLMRLIDLSRSTGTLYIEEDPEYVIEKALSFMESIAGALPFSNQVDEEAHALAKRIRGEYHAVPIVTG